MWGREVQDSAVLTNISTQRVKGNSLQFMVWILLQTASLQRGVPEAGAGAAAPPSHQVVTAEAKFGK